MGFRAKFYPGCPLFFCFLFMNKDDALWFYMVSSVHVAKLVDIIIW